MNRDKLSLEPHHLGVPSGVSKMISTFDAKPCTCLALRLTLYPNGLKWVWHDPHHIGVPSDAYKTTLNLWYVLRKQRTHLVSRLALSPNGRNKLPLEPCHLGVPSDASKMIPEPMVRLAQTVHLSCTTNTVSKWIETRFDMTHVTLGFHWVHPK
jgi:hypothetical protein